MKPNVPLATSVRAKRSLFSVRPASRSSRSTATTSRRGTTAAATTIARAVRRLTSATAREPALVDVAPLPELEHERGSRCARRGRRGRSCGRRAAARPRRAGTDRGACVERIEEHVRRRVAQLLAEPLRDGHAEAGLAPRRGSRPAGRPRTPAAARSCRVEPCCLSPSGRPSASSARWWSRSGARSSSECAIEAMSALKRRSSGQVGLDVDQLEARDARPRAAARAASPAAAEHPISASASLRPELGPQLRREHLHQAARSARPDRDRPCRGTARRGTRPSAAPCGPTGCSRSARAAAAVTDARDAVEALGQRVRAVALVAAEDLVAAVARERDGDEASGVLADEERRQRGRVAERLVVRRRRAAGSAPRASGSSDELLVDRAVALGDEPGVAPLVVALVRRSRPRTSAPGPGSPAPWSRRRRSSRSRPRAARRAARPRRGACARRWRTPSRTASSHSASLRGALGAGLELPVALDAHLPALGDEDAAGPEAVDPLDGRLGAGHVAEREVGVEPLEARPPAVRAGTRAAPSARTRTRASRRAGASRGAASCRSGRGRAGAALCRASQSASANIPSRRSTKRSPCCS